MLTLPMLRRETGMDMMANLMIEHLRQGDLAKPRQSEIPSGRSPQYVVNEELNACGSSSFCPMVKAKAITNQHSSAPAACFPPTISTVERCHIPQHY